jgi:peptidyl-prolyl cis-trans isomerase A (cyclophilin A)
MRYIIGLFFLVGMQLCASARAATIIRFDTVMGSFDIQMFDSQMPRTVQNFVAYVNADRYDGTVVHRNSDTSDPVLRDFVIQGGGYRLHDPNPPNPNATITFSNVTLNPAIADEPGGGVVGPSNLRGTIAMAKSGPNTVTSQWFINQGDNSFLDSPARSDGGFSAFGMVLGNGMTVVDAIGDLPIPSNFGFSIGSPFNDIPLRNFSGSAINHVRVANTVTVNSISVLSLPTGDFDRSGSVNLADLTILRSGYGLTTGAYLDDGDADMDGDVDGRDFLLWQRNFGSSAPLTTAVAVPEPAASVFLLAAMGLTATFRFRNR